MARRKHYDDVPVIQFGGITKPKPYITIAELKKIGKELTPHNPNDSWVLAGHAAAIVNMLQAAAKIARERGKK